MKQSALCFLALAAVLVAAAPAQATEGSWDANSAGNWSDSTKWLNGIIPNAADDIANFTYDISGNRTITIDAGIGSVALGTIRFADASHSYTIAASTGLTLTMDVASGSATMTFDVGNSRDHTISASVVLADNLDVSLASNRLSLTGKLTGTGNITKSGDGELYVNNSTNDVVGDWYVNAGTLYVDGGDSRLGNAANDVYLNGGTLRGDDNITLGAGRVITIGASGGTINWTGNTLTLNNANHLAGAGSVTLTKTGGGTLKITAGQAGFLGTVTVDGGTLSLEAASAVNNNVTANDATVTVTNATAAGAGSDITANANAQINVNVNPADDGTDYVVADLAAISATDARLNLLNADSLTIAAGAMIAHQTNAGTGKPANLSGNPDYIYGLSTNMTGYSPTVGSNSATDYKGIGSDRSSRTLGAAGATTLTLDGSAELVALGGSTLTIDSQVVNGAAVGTVTKRGSGTVRLNDRTNSFTGTVALEAGTLQLGYAAASTYDTAGSFDSATFSNNVTGAARLLLTPGNNRALKLTGTHSARTGVTRIESGYGIAQASLGTGRVEIPNAGCLYLLGGGVSSATDVIRGGAETNDHIGIGSDTGDNTFGGYWSGGENNVVYTRAGSTLHWKGDADGSWTPGATTISQLRANGYDGAIIDNQLSGGGYQTIRKIGPGTLAIDLNFDAAAYNGIDDDLYGTNSPGTGRVALGSYIRLLDGTLDIQTTGEVAPIRIGTTSGSTTTLKFSVTRDWTDSIATEDSAYSQALLPDGGGGGIGGGTIEVASLVTLNLKGSLTVNDGHTLTKTGDGALRIADGGALAVGVGSTYTSNEAICLDGGVYAGSGDFALALGQSAGEVYWTATTNGGGFAAFHGQMDVNIGGSLTPDTLTWGQTDFVQTGAPLILGSAIGDNVANIKNPLNLADAERTVRVDGTGAGNVGRLSGDLTGGGASAKLVKTGAGILEITSTGSSVANGVHVNEGTLQLNTVNIGANLPITLNDDGRLNLRSDSSCQLTSGSVTVNSASANPSTINMDRLGAVAVNERLDIAGFTVNANCRVDFASGNEYDIGITGPVALGAGAEMRQGNDYQKMSIFLLNSSYTDTATSVLYGDSWGTASKGGFWFGMGGSVAVNAEVKGRRACLTACNNTTINYNGALSGSGTQWIRADAAGDKIVFTSLATITSGGAQFAPLGAGIVEMAAGFIAGATFDGEARIITTGGWETNDNQNLPSAVGGTIRLEGGTWRTKTAAQAYGNRVSGNGTIDTQTNLTLSGAFDIGGTMIKAGSATLDINGTQTHSAGAALKVEDGVLNMTTSAGTDVLAVYASSGGQINFSTAGQDLAGLGAETGTGTANVPFGLTINAQGLAISAGATLVKSGAGDLNVTGAQTHGAGSTFQVAGGTVNINTNAGTPATAVDPAVANLTLSITGGTVNLGAEQILDDLSITGSTLDLKDQLVRMYQVSGAEAKLRGLLNAGKIIDSLKAGDEGVGYTDQRTDDYGTQYVAIRTVFKGDGNMDGKVSFADFSDLLANYGGTGKTWDLGDYNYDGSVSFADFSDLLSNYGKTGGNHVPEPATLALMVLGGLGLLARRRG